MILGLATRLFRTSLLALAIAATGVALSAGEGEQGLPGPQGLTGEPGIQGKTGPQGPPGTEVQSVEPAA